MSRGILIFGSAGAGKTTLGRITAQQLGLPFYSTDDYFWRAGMKYPYTLMLPREERAQRLMDALPGDGRFVLSGALDTVSEPFEPMLALAVYLTTNTRVRLERLQQREYKRWGNRILKGGDLYPMHERFLKMAARYDSDSVPNADAHAEWSMALPCPVLRLSGDMEPEVNAGIITKAYRQRLENA